MAEATTYNICSINPEKSDVTHPLILLLRDVVLVLLFIGAYVLLQETVRSFNYTWLVIMYAGLGFYIGLRANSVLHEWGHYLGAKFTGSKAPTNGFTKLFPMFNFDIERNTHKQFMAMSIGGSLFEWLFPLVLVFVLGYQSLENLALLSGAMLMAFSGSFIEAPIIIDAIRRGDGHSAWQDYLKVRPFRVKIGSFLGMTSALVFFIVMYGSSNGLF